METLLSVKLTMGVDDKSREGVGDIPGAKYLSQLDISLGENYRGTQGWFISKEIVNPCKRQCHFSIPLFNQLSRKTFGFPRKK